MLHHAVVFLAVTIGAAILGFGGVGGTAASLAQMLFFVALTMFLVSLVSKRRPI